MGFNRESGDMYPMGASDFGVLWPHAAGPMLLERLELAEWIVSDIPEQGRVLEVGSYAGSTACYLAHNRPQAELVCVDAFPGDSFKDVRDLWLINKRENMHLAYCPTRVFYSLCQPASFDLAIVDDGHEKHEVLFDLENVVRLVKPGSPIFVHDYDFPGWTKVTEAVDEFCGRGG